MTDSITENSGVDKKPEAQTLAQIIYGQIQTLRNYYSLVLDTQEVEAIHKMRVTTRRLQASLDLLEIDKAERSIGKLKKRLRRLRGKLSEVRNYDVFLIILEQEAGKRRTVNPPFASLEEELRRRRALRADKMMQYLRKIDFNKFFAILKMDWESSNQGEVSLAHLADDKAIAGRAAARIEQRLREFKDRAINAQPITHPEELHQLRIAAKRLRYLLEIATDMGIRGNLTALGWLRALQDKIGDWHDFEAIEDEIINITANREFVKKHLRESHAILKAAVHLRKQKLALVKRLFPVKMHPSIESAASRTANTYRKKFNLVQQL
ncbi:MAG: CHAD domain-containing protein [Acidobacteriota bacterium]